MFTNERNIKDRLSTLLKLLYIDALYMNMVSLSKITIVTAKNACISVILMCNRFKKLNTVRDNNIKKSQNIS